MSIITLITDWGTDGSYVGAMKGKILSQQSDVTIVDVANNIKPFDKIQAAYVLRNCHHIFPKGTIHIIGVGGNQENVKSEFIAFEKDGYFFLGKNDGIWGLVFEEMPNEIVVFSGNDESQVNGFPELQIFSTCIDIILKTQSIKDIGPPLKKLFVRHRQLPSVNQNQILGEIVYFDIYGNAVTNISLEDFNRVNLERNFKIHINSLKNFVNKINSSYDQTERGEILAIWGYSGFLEIAIANGSTKELLNLSVSNTVRISFVDKDDISQPSQGKSTLF